jgi:hypothetical protein
MGKEYNQTGNNIEEALIKMNLGWEQVKGKGTITVSLGEQTHEHLFQMKILRRIFANKIMMTHWAKNLEFLLKSDVKTNLPKL